MEGEGVRVGSLPDRLEEWIDRRAAELGTDRRGVLARAVVALRTLEEGTDDSAVDPDRLEERVSGLETDVDAKIDDVRERVVQVKRETDAKADADHDHPDLRESAVAARTEAAEAVDRAESASAAVAEVGDRMDAGFENFEEVSSHLREVTADTESRLDATARAVLDLRDRVADLERTATRSEAAAAIRAEANRRGVTDARCESCGASVSLGLLDAPVCPDCDATFDGLGPDPGLFRTPVLTAGEPAALAATPEADRGETPADSFDVGGDGEGAEPDADPVDTPADVFEPDAVGEGGGDGG